MLLVTGKKLKQSILSKSEDSVFLDPILDEDQIGSVTVDIRLGYDFLVSIVTRKPYIELSSYNGKGHRGISSYFQETRREIGDRFVLYPDQVVLTTSLEYLSLPPNIYADILSRSSYTRLGIHINTMVQPGFKGCIPIELYNHGNNAIELIVGSRICQARFFEIEGEADYTSGDGIRKYYGDVRPTSSRADKDVDLPVLEIARKSLE
jgi:dCTP deaminase